MENESRVRVKVRTGNTEIEVEGKKEEIEGLVVVAEKIENMIRKRGAQPLDSSFAIPDEPSTETGPPTTEIPHISGQKLNDQLVELLQSAWGRVPRTLNEIREALELNAIHYPNTTIAPVLIQLTKKGKLRRLKKDKVYAYVAAQRM
jgi:6-pyruvoyl-tetrahydropterin synthase